MARKETRKERWAKRDRTVVVQVELRVDTLAAVDELVASYGQTRQQAIQEAVFDWTLRWQRKHTRAERISLERRIREARDEVPLGPLLERFREQMEAASRHSVRGVVRLPHMESDEGVTKQVAAQLDVEFYDRIAGIAKGDDRSIAYLIRKGLEKVAAEHDAAQSRESSIAAA